MVSLTVDLSQPFANACDLHIDHGPPATVRFTADPRGGPEALWFCLRLDWPDHPAGAEIDLVLTNPSNLLGGGGPADAWRPVWRGPGHDWLRLPGGVAEALPDGRREVRWRLPSAGEWCEVAFCYPYGPAELEYLVAELGAPWQLDTIGVSQGARPLVRLGNGPGQPGDQRPGIYCLARQHAGETPGSWALDGFLRAMAAAGDAAPLVWCVPLANIDGVVQGDYGKDNYPYDLNRAWGAPPFRHETLVIGDDVRRFARRCQPLLCLDWHAPGACETDGVYAFRFPTPAGQPDTAADQRTSFAKALGSLASANFSRLADYPSRWATPSFTRWVNTDLDLPAISLEVPYAMVGETVLTREIYREIGVRLAEAVMARLS